MTQNLVTGAGGFVGQHLVAELLGRGEGVVGAVLFDPPELTTLSQSEAGKVTWVQADLERPAQVRSLVAGRAFDRVYHLAGFSSEQKSHENADSVFTVNVLGTLHLLEALTAGRYAEDVRPRVIISGSSQVYGSAASRYNPLNEECPVEPLSPYAVSKATQELLGLQFHRTSGLSVIVTRSFNHTGPGQRPPFVAPQLASQIVDAERGERSATLLVGNPEIRRDFSDVRDVVRAYVLLADRGEVGQIYNVCSGRSYAIGELIDMMAEIAGVEVTVERDPERARSVDIPEMVGDASKLRSATSWSPEIDIRETLKGLLDSARSS